MNQKINNNGGFEVLTAVAMKSSVSGDITGLHGITFQREDTTLLSSPKVTCCWCKHLVVIFNYAIVQVQEIVSQMEFHCGALSSTFSHNIFFSAAIMPFCHPENT
jgi:hypothetical protein